MQTSLFSLTLGKNASATLSKLNFHLMPQFQYLCNRTAETSAYIFHA